MDEQIKKTDAQLKHLNRWLIALVIFIVIWTLGVFIYLYQKPSPPIPPVPFIAIDYSNGKITNSAHTNLFPKSFGGQSKTNEYVSPLFEQRSSYEKMDFVIINYFFIAGLVVDRQGDNYTVMYKDYNKVLQRIIVPVELLLYPTSSYGVNPASLLAP